MVGLLTETDKIDFLYALISPDKYPYPLDAEDVRLLEAILDESCVSKKTKAALMAPTRHLFWYVGQQGRAIGSIDDELIVKFIVEEIPKSNSGSTH